MKRARYAIALCLLLVAVLSPARGQGETVFTSEPLEGITTVVVNVGSVDITIEPAAGAPQFEARLHENRRLSLSRSGARAEITIDGTIGFMLGSVREEFILSLPEGISVVIDAASSDLSVRGMQRISLEVEAASGDVTVRDATGIFEVSTASGDHEYLDVSGVLRLSAASGDISFDGVSGVEQVETSSGDVTGGGLYLSSDLEITTVSGDLDLEIENSADELRFELSAASGDLRVDDTRAEGSLVSGGGNILVRARSASGDQRFRTR